MDLEDLLVPAHTALVTHECQKGVLGEIAIFPQLAEDARGCVVNIARLAKAARASGVAVVHCVAAHPRNMAAYNRNARLFGAARKSGVDLAEGSEATQVIDQIGVDPLDVVLSRVHGIGPMRSTDLDPVLRNLETKTIVAVGVSVNIGVTNLVMDAVNAGYQVVLPRDAVAGIPADYADAVIDNTLSLLSTITTTDDVIEVWER